MIDTSKFFAARNGKMSTINFFETSVVVCIFIPFAMPRKSPTPNSVVICGGNDNIKSCWGSNIFKKLETHFVLIDRRKSVSLCAPMNFKRSQKSSLTLSLSHTHTHTNFSHPSFEPKFSRGFLSETSQNRTRDGCSWAKYVFLVGCDVNEIRLSQKISSKSNSLVS